MTRTAIPTLLLLLSSCGGGFAEVEGEVAGKGLTDINTVMFGGPFIVMADVDLDCLDISWVTRHYTQGEAVTDYDFRMLQFAFSDPDVVEGVYNLAGEAAVTAKFLVQSDMAFAEYRGRGGNLQVDTVDEDKVAIGLFDLEFDEGALNGDYNAEWCRNLRDN